MTEFFLGVDGGGTSCRAALANAEGVVLGKGRSGSANIFTDVSGATHNIVEAAGEACNMAGLPIDTLEKTHAVLGLAGANVETTVNEAKERLPFKSCDIESDALIAAHGALGGRDGAIAVLGTGSVFAQKRGDVVETKGGWGFVVGDQGAGAALGRSLLREALLVFDGVREGSDLAAHVLAEFKHAAPAISNFAHSAVPGEFARYAPKVFEAAEQGDPVAVRLLREAASQVDEFLTAILTGPDDRLCLLGGLGPLYAPWLAPDHQARIAEPQADALSGATQLAVARIVVRRVDHG